MPIDKGGEPVGFNGQPRATAIALARDKAERIIAQILRDDHGMKPAEANDAANAICNRLIGSMPIHGGSPQSNGDGPTAFWRTFR